MEVDKQLYAEIKEYCELNGLKPRDFTNNLLKKAFMEEKYGKMPAVLRSNVGKEPKIIEVPKESRQDSRQDVAKEEKPAKNDDFRDKNETIGQETSYIEENQPIATVSEEKKAEEKKTIKKRKL